MKKLTGVWLDHSKAKMIEISDGSAEITTVQSPYKRRIRIPGEGSNATRFGKTYFSNVEFKTNQKKQNDIDSYYKDLEKRLKGFDSILLFGPTRAKAELSNYLSENKHFSSKKITIKNADKMTENQMIEFVRNHFSK
ncbi:MAG: hypothetical protein JSS91_06550 [Bacteroidetes bacterium]|nr:hypothetical protein [Bacteroidota bacterium]